MEHHAPSSSGTEQRWVGMRRIPVMEQMSFKCGNVCRGVQIYIENEPVIIILGAIQPEIPTSYC